MNPYVIDYTPISKGLGDISQSFKDIDERKRLEAKERRDEEAFELKKQEQARLNRYYDELTKHQALANEGTENQRKAALELGERFKVANNLMPVEESSAFKGKVVPTLGSLTMQDVDINPIGPPTPEPSNSALVGSAMSKTGSNQPLTKQEAEAVISEIVDNPSFNDLNVERQKKTLESAKAKLTGVVVGIRKPTIITDQSVLEDFDSAYPTIASQSSLKNAKIAAVHIAPSPDGDPLKYRYAFEISGIDPKTGQPTTGAVTVNRTSDPNDKTLVLTGGDLLSQAEAQQVALKTHDAAMITLGDAETRKLVADKQERRDLADAMVEAAKGMEPGKVQQKVLFEAQLLRSGKITVDQANKTAALAFPTKTWQALGDKAVDDQGNWITIKSHDDVLTKVADGQREALVNRKGEVVWRGAPLPTGGGGGAGEKDTAVQRDIAKIKSYVDKGDYASAKSLAMSKGLIPKKDAFVDSKLKQYSGVNTDMTIEGVDKLRKRFEIEHEDSVNAYLKELGGTSPELRTRSEKLLSDLYPSEAAKKGKIEFKPAHQPGKPAELGETRTQGSMQEGINARAKALEEKKRKQAEEANRNVTKISLPTISLGGMNRTQYYDPASGQFVMLPAGQKTYPGEDYKGYPILRR